MEQMNEINELSEQMKDDCKINEETIHTIHIKYYKHKEQIKKYKEQMEEQFNLCTQLRKELEKKIKGYYRY